MLQTRCFSTGPVILVFNFHVNFLSVTGRDLLNESNTFTLNPKPVALWRRFGVSLNPKPFSSPRATIQNEAAVKRVSAACLYRLFDRYFYLRENENKLDGFIILSL